MTYAEKLELLVAYAAGELTEGQVVALTGMDLVDVHGEVADLLRKAKEAWQRHRKDNPPRWARKKGDPGGQG